MPQDLISKRTRQLFREWLVEWTLRTIEELFERYDIEYKSLSTEELPSGERRALVECYYASVDWKSISQTRRVLDAYEDILVEASEAEKDEQKLIQALEKDGYSCDGVRIFSEAREQSLVDDTFGTLETSIDVENLNLYMERIRTSIETDPSLAIGSTKELVEATLKTILDALNIDQNGNEDIPSLFKKVQKQLKLAPAEIDDSKKGAKAIKQLLSNVSGIVTKMAEIRNIYGTGHGRSKPLLSLTPRHAKLMAGLGSTLCVFLLETYEHRNKVTYEELRKANWLLVHTFSFSPPSRVKCIDIHPSGKYVFSGDEAHMIRVWELNSGKLHSEYIRLYDKENSGDVNSLTLSRNGEFVITTGHTSSSIEMQTVAQDKIQMLNWSTGNIVSCFPPSSRFDNGYTISACPKHDILACDSVSDIELFNYKNKKKIQTLRGHNAHITSVCFSPDGDFLVSSSKDGVIRVWQWRTGQLTDTFATSSKPINVLAISPDNEVVAAGGESNVYFYNLKAKKHTLTLKGHLDSINTISFSSDGKLIATGSMDDTIRIWHTRTGNALHVIEGNSCWKGVRAVKFFKDGRKLVAGLEGGEVKIWQRE